MNCLKNNRLLFFYENASQKSEMEIHASNEHEWNFQTLLLLLKLLLFNLPLHTPPLMDAETIHAMHSFFSSTQFELLLLFFSCSVMSDSVRPHEL